MKKIASILAFVFAFTLSTEAQQRGRQQKGPQMTVEQRSELMVKQLTLSLDLTEKQQNEILPILKAQAEEKKAAMIKKKEMQKNDTKPTADEIFEMKSKILDQRIEFRNKMKAILKADQFEKFEEMAKKRAQQGKKMMMKKGAMKKRDRK